MITSEKFPELRENKLLHSESTTYPSQEIKIISLEEQSGETEEQQREELKNGQWEEKKVTYKWL